MAAVVSRTEHLRWTLRGSAFPAARFGAGVAAEFVKAQAPTDEQVQALMQAIINRLMKLLTHRVVPVEATGKACLAERHIEGDEARALISQQSPMTPCNARRRSPVH